LLLFRKFAYLFTILHFLVVEATIKGKYKQQTRSDDTATAAAAAADRRHNDVSATGHGSSDVIQKAEEDSGRPRVVCAGSGKRDHLVVFATSTGVDKGGPGGSAPPPQWPGKIFWLK